MQGSNTGFEQCDIARHPYTFVDKKDSAIFISPLKPAQHNALIAFYSTTIPRNCFNGLPPIRNDLCLQWIQRTIADAFNLVGMTCEDGIVGHTCLFPMSSRSGEMLIAVAPEFRDRGIGTQMARAIIQVAFESGLDKLWLSVEAANHVARHIYNKCGFQYLTISQVDEVEMALDLSRYRHRTRTTIREIMNRDVVTVPGTASCAEVIDVILKRHLGALPVVDNDGRLLGIISETDLIMEVSLSQRVSDIMTRKVLSMKADCQVSKAIRIFQSKKIRVLPVTDEANRVVGIIGRKDILAYYHKTLGRNKKAPG